MKHASMKTRWKAYFRCLPFVDACLFCARDTIGNTTPKKTRVAGRSVYLRACLSDIAVAMSALDRREYADITAEEVKVVIDVGANVGTSAIYFADEYPDATVYAIEMEATNFAVLEKNAATRGNIMPVHAAIAGRSGQRHISARDTGPCGFTIAETSDNTIPTGQIVSCLTLDEFIVSQGIDHIDILKLDIEGAEKDVLSTGGRWLDVTSILIAELHDRMVVGCEEAFLNATRQFDRYERHGEKVVAFR